LRTDAHIDIVASAFAVVKLSCPRDISEDRSRNADWADDAPPALCFETEVSKRPTKPIDSQSAVVQQRMRPEQSRTRVTGVARPPQIERRAAGRKLQIRRTEDHDTSLRGRRPSADAGFDRAERSAARPARQLECGIEPIVGRH
jgi:hypothetical protein